MNENLNGTISYEKLRQIICDYFKQNQDFVLSSTSIDYLKDKLRGNEDPRPFFIVRNEFGEARFDISKEEIQNILRSYMASKNCELVSVDYDYDVKLKYNQNPEIDRSNEEKVELDLTYNGYMDYTDLRQMIFDYYKENKGIQLNSISIEYLKSKMTNGGLNNYQPFFIMRDETGEKRFDISKEEMQEILKERLAKKNYELTSLTFGNTVEFSYKQGKKQEKKVDEERTDLEATVDKNDEVTKKEDVPTTQFKTTDSLTNESPKQSQKKAELEDLMKQLDRSEREKRKFTILQRERAMNNAKNAKHRSALLAGACILGAAVASYFNGQDLSQVIQHELNAIYSWEALGQYIKDLGPMTTLLVAGAGTFISKYFKNSRKFKQAQQEFEDYNASLENINTNELGGNENAKSR